MERRMYRRTFTKAVPFFLGALAVTYVVDRVVPGQTGQSIGPDLFNYLKGDIDEQGRQRDAVDPELNHGRTNFLFFVQGETHEPPLIERGIIGSHTLISINSQRYVIDRISWTHDLRAPEVERYLQQNGKGDGQAKKIDEAYRYGGFPLMRQAVEAATGLAVHFQVAADDSLLVDVVDKVASKIQIENPKGFWAYKIYSQGRSYPERYFAQGKQSLDGVTALQYIKAVPKEDPDPLIEHNRRKHLVMQALQKEMSQPTNLLMLAKTLREAATGGSINFDGPFDKLIKRGENISLTVEMTRYLLGGGAIGDLLPKTGREIYLVDPAHGDGGMQWVTANAAQNPITKKDIENGIYPPNVGFEVPFDHRMDFQTNPYAEDLIKGYWLPLRLRILKLLTN